MLSCNKRRNKVEARSMEGKIYICERMIKVRRYLIMSTKQHDRYKCNQLCYFMLFVYILDICYFYVICYFKRDSEQGGKRKIDR